MHDIRNLNGKLVCRADQKLLSVDVVHRGMKTTIRFMPDGGMTIINTNEHDKHLLSTKT